MLAPHLQDPASIIGKVSWDVFPDQCGTIIEHELRRAVRDGISVEFEVYFAPFARWFSIRAFPQSSGGITVYARDITTRKSAAASTPLGDEKYESLFESVEQGFCVIEMIYDSEGKPVDFWFVEVNPAFERHTGWADAANRTAREILPTLEAHWATRYGKVAETGEPEMFEGRSDVMGRDFSVYAWRVGSPEQCRVALLFSDVTARKLAEKEVARLAAESRRRLSELETLLEVVPVGIGIASDRDCRRIRLNPALAKMLGLTPEANGSKTAEVHERPANFHVFDSSGAEIPDAQLPMQVAARDGKESRDVDLTVVRDGGLEVRLAGYAAPLFDERGNASGSVGVFVDISERRAAEETHRFLVALDDAVRPLVDPGAIVATAAKMLGEQLHADRCAYAEVEADEDTFNITGDYCRDVPSIIGRYTFAQFGSEALRQMRENRPFVLDDADHHTPPIEDLATYHATLIRAAICVPLHKARRFVAAMAVHQTVPRKWTQREVELVLHVANRCWEALERSRVTRVLAESEERFRALADNIAQLAWMTDPAGWMFWFNRRWFDYTGGTLKQMLGWGWGTVIHADHLERVTSKWKEHLASGMDWEDTFPLRGKDGEYRWFLSRAFPIRDRSGKVIRWFGTNTDVTEQRKAAEILARDKNQAEEASRLKDEFLAALSHELRTPLTPVLLSAAAMQEDDRLPDETRSELAMIRRNIELEARLIDDLLDLTSISRGKFTLRLQECDVHALLGLAVDIARDDAQAKGLSIDLELRAQHARLHCDPARMQQVFWNLLKNAVKFTPMGGRIIARSRDDGEFVVVEVSDSGIGIDPDVLQKIFLPFEQGEHGTDHRFGGLGLGLAISQAIVEMHKGSIGAHSEGKGMGATFAVRLPTCGKKTENHSIPAGTTIPRVAEECVPVAPMRLLLVEDHEPTLTVLARLLSRAGHTITAAMTVGAARSLAAENRFDAVVSDIGLPDGTGLELMRELNANYGLLGIALTGYGMEDDLRRSREVGFVAHLVKPVDLAQLRLAIAHLAAAIPKK